jgi:hypothetical protein
MVTETLWARFEALRTSVDGSTSAAVAAEATQSHLLTKGSGGEPVLLLRCEARRTPRTPIRLKHVGVIFDETFEVRLQPDDPVAVGRYTKLVCSPASPSLHRWFVELASAVTQSVPGEMSTRDVDDLLNSLLELFRQAAAPSAETVLGLWGELLAIDMAADSSAFTRAWHSSPTEAFDFDFSESRLEVKTTLRPSREHSFALNQVGSGRASDYVLSIVAQRASGGESVLGLARRVAARLPDKSRERLWRIVVETLGPEVDGVDDQCFDVASAKHSARMFHARDIPAPIVEPRHQAVVTNVRFSTSLGQLGEGLPLTLLGKG